MGLFDLFRRNAVTFQCPQCDTTLTVYPVQNNIVCDCDWQVLVPSDIWPTKENNQYLHSDWRTFIRCFEAWPLKDFQRTKSLLVFYALLSSKIPRHVLDKMYSNVDSIEYSTAEVAVDELVDHILDDAPSVKTTVYATRMNQQCMEEDPYVEKHWPLMIRYIKVALVPEGMPQPSYRIFRIDSGAYVGTW